MKSSRHVSLTLHHTDASEPPAVVLVNSNWYGQLPAVLVDPIDRNGRVVSGMWLGDALGERTDGTSYVQLRRPEFR